MRPPPAISFLVTATALSGLLAGGNFVRMFIEMPAWRRTGSMSWAAFSKRADLGTGLVLYPMLAIGGALFTIAAWVMVRREPSVKRAALPLGVATILVAAGLALTSFAAPQMLSLPALGNDAGAVQRAFEAFNFWGNLRGVVQILAFAADLWAFARLLGPAPS